MKRNYTLKPFACMLACAIAFSNIPVSNAVAAELPAEVPAAQVSATTDAEEAYVNPFSDVSDDAWYAKSVQYAVQNGLFTGTSATTFTPDGKMTRGMLVTVLYRAAGRPTVTDAKTYPDVTSDAYYAKAVAWASSIGMATGYSDGSFHPNDPVTREQVAKILYQYARYSGEDVTKRTDITGYRDYNKISSWAVKYMEWTAAEGVLTGSSNKLNPKGDATRAEIASILRRYLESRPATSDPDTEEPGTDVPDTEEPDTETPDTEEPTTDAPDTEEPTTDAPDTEEPDTEEPDTEEPATEEPGTEEPGTEEPDTEAPDTEEPGTEAPDTEEPSTEEPGTEAPDTEEPSTEEPSTEEPTPDAPVTTVESEIVLDDTCTWYQGRYENGTQTEEANFIRNDIFYDIEAIETLEFTETNLYGRIIISEFDADRHFIKETDLCGNALLLKDSQTKYITISVYEFKDSQIQEHTYEQMVEWFQNGQVITLKSVNQEDYLHGEQKVFTGYITGNDICNLGIYQYGSYASWGNSYTDGTDYSVSRLLFEVNPEDTYYFNTNDSRFGISLFQYDEDGNYIYAAGLGTLENGASYTPTDAKTKYIRIIPHVSQWSVGIDDLADKGLWCNFSTENQEFKTEHVDINTFDFSDFNNYRAGSYYYNTGEYIISDSSICAKYYLDLNGDTKARVVRTYNSYIKMTIIEYDEAGTRLANTTCQNGQTWQPNEGTAYICLTLENTNHYTYEQYKQELSEHSIEMPYYEKYNYNTEMQDITAWDYVNYFDVAWNLGNSFDSYYGEWPNDTEMHDHECTWGNVYVTEELIDFVNAQGINSIRIPVTWYLNSYLGEDGHYHINEAYLSRVQDVVDYAIENDMYVMLNTHFDAGKSSSIIKLGQDDEAMENVYLYCSDIWTDIGTYFKDYDEHLCFESYNEVQLYNAGFTYSDVAAEQMNKINQIFVDSVRATGSNNANRVLCVQTLASMYSTETLEAFVMPEDTVDDKMIVQVHYYPSAYDQSIESVLTSLETFSNEIDAPVVIGECGLKNNYALSEYTAIAYSNLVKRAQMHGIKCYIWDDGNLTADGSYGVIDRTDFDNSQLDVLNAMTHPVAYSSGNITIFDSYDSFIWKTLDQSTGEVKDDPYWGTVITDQDGYGIEIPEGTDYLLAGTSKDGNSTVSTINLQYIHFYDESMTLITAYNSGNSTYREIPDGAKYVRFGLNSSYHATTELMYKYYFDSKQLNLYVNWIDVDDPTNPYVETFDGSTIFTDTTKIEPECMFINFDDIDIHDFSSWESGTYNHSTKLKETNTACIRSNDYYILDRDFTEATHKVTYSTNNSVLRLSVYAFDEDFKCLGSSTLVDAQEFELDENVKYISFVLSAPYGNLNPDYATYQSLFENDSNIISISID